MKDRTSLSQFASVDRAADPGFLIDYLDAASATEEAVAYKRLTFALQRAGAGDSVIDVGCGTGEDARMLADIVGEEGSVVALDSSEAIISEARRRSRPSGCPVEYRQGDICRLPFASETFDSCRADRVFQHLDRPQDALAELVRVCRSKGWVVASDPDWETLVVDGPDQLVTRKLVTFFCDTLANGRVGRQLRRHFVDASLEQVRVVPVTLVLTDHEAAEQLVQLTALANQAADKGAAGHDEAEAWLRDIRAAAEREVFFLALTGFVVAGQKP